MDELENELRGHIEDLETYQSELEQLRGEIEDIERNVQATKTRLKEIDEKLDEAQDAAYNDDEDAELAFDDIDYLNGLLEEANDLVEGCAK